MSALAVVIVITMTTKVTKNKLTLRNFILSKYKKIIILFLPLDKNNTMYNYPQYRSGVSLAFFIIFLIALWFGGAALLGSAAVVDEANRGEFTAFGVIAALIVALLWTAVIWLIYPHWAWLVAIVIVLLIIAIFLGLAETANN